MGGYDSDKLISFSGIDNFKLLTGWASSGSDVVHLMSSPALPKLIAEQTGAKLVKLPIMPGGVPNTSTYIEMIDYNLHTLVEAAKEKGLAAR